eukprot:970578_1
MKYDAINERYLRHHLHPKYTRLNQYIMAQSKIPNGKQRSATKYQTRAKPIVFGLHKPSKHCVKTINIHKRTDYNQWKKTQIKIITPQVVKCNRHSHKSYKQGSQLIKPAGPRKRTKSMHQTKELLQKTYSKTMVDKVFKKKKQK